MPLPFQVINTQFVIEIDSNPSIRKRVFEFEEKLTDYFKVPFRTIPAPDSIDPSIPRFESQSINGHSLLQVSGTRLVLKTNYEENFQGELQKISDYISLRASIFNDLLKPEKKLFIAYIVELGFEMNPSEINSFFKDHTGLIAVENSTIDVSMLYSQPFLEKYFLNVKCSKFVSAKIKIQNDRIIPTDEKKFGISVNLDINSRLHLNKGLIFDDKLVDDISNVIFTLIKGNEITNYLNGSLNV